MLKQGNRSECRGFQFPRGPVLERKTKIEIEYEIKKVELGCGVIPICYASLGGGEMFEFCNECVWVTKLTR